MSFFDRLSEGVGDFVNNVNTYAQQSQSPNRNPTQVGPITDKINLETATKEELISFIKKQSTHIKTIEGRCVEIFERFKKVKAEKEELASKAKAIPELQMQLQKAAETVTQNDKLLKQAQLELERSKQEQRKQKEAHQQAETLLQQKLLSAKQQIKRLQEVEQKETPNNRNNENVTNSDPIVDPVQQASSEPSAETKKIKELEIRCEQAAEVNRKLSEKIKTLEDEVIPTLNIEKEELQQVVEKQKLEQVLENQKFEKESQFLENQESQFLENPESQPLENQESQPLENQKRVGEDHTSEKQKQDDQLSHKQTENPSASQFRPRNDHEEATPEKIVDVTGESAQKEKEEVAQLQKDLTTKIKEIQQLKAKLSEATKSAENGKSALETLQKELQISASESKQLKSKLSTLQQEHEKEKQTTAGALHKLVEQRNELQKELLGLKQTHKTSVEQLEKRTRQMENDRNLEHITLMEEKENRQRLTQEVQNLTENNKSLQERLQKAESTHKTAVEKLKNLLQKANIHISENQTVLQNRKQKIEELNTELNSALEEISHLKTEKSNLEERYSEELIRKEKDLKENEIKKQKVESQLQQCEEEFRQYKICAQQALQKQNSESGSEAVPTQLIEEFQEQITQLKTQCTTLQKQNGELLQGKQSLELLKSTLIETERKLNELTVVHSQLKNQAQKTERTLQQTNQLVAQEKDEALKQLAQALQDHKTLTEERNSLKEALKKAEESLQEERKNQQAKTQKLKTQIEELQNKLNTNSQDQDPKLPPSQISSPLQASHSPSSQPMSVPNSANQPLSPSTPPSQSPNEAGGFDQLLHFTQLQTLNREEVSKARQKIRELTELLTESQQTEQLLSQQTEVLKEEIRNLQRGMKRETVNLEYLKNIVYKFIMNGQDQKLLPVLQELLQFSPNEMKLLRDKIVPTGGQSGFFSSLWTSTNVPNNNNQKQ